jgi:hypothetical protein
MKLHTSTVPASMIPPARRGGSSLSPLQRPFLLLLLLLQLCSAKSQRRHSSFSPDEFAVRGLVDVEPAFGTFDGAMYAGVLPVSTTTTADDDNADDENIGHLMFWYFDARSPTVDDTIVVWFNGGPGCSSFDAGLLFEFVRVQGFVCCLLCLLFVVSCHGACLS